ncbi:MAG TPA: galactokinase family protein [Longimicrobiales bacterium]|nr:galactokinase family protein [Longimicrobiales bacterium]
MGDSAARRFQDVFGRLPTIAVRVPGRVNLIGEHIDYHGLPVLPFAIDRGLTVLASPASDRHPARVRFMTAAPGLPADDFDLGEPMAPLGSGDWRDYPRAAASWIVAMGGAGRGLDALVVSDLPMASGLSSSSALVVASALALSRVNEYPVEPLTLAEQLAAAERFTGTRGGGMDQAACLLSRRDHATRLSFDPLRAEHVPFPRDLSVIVVDSGERAAKAGSVQAPYNDRRSVGAAALAAVAGRLGMTDATYPRLLHERPADELLDVARGTLEATPFARFRHVVTEAGRVDAASAALSAWDGDRLGRLLMASHASLRDDYEVSTPRLDAIVEAALEAGALGARLTGAGFGGSVIVLAEVESAPDLGDALRAWCEGAGFPVGGRRDVEAQAAPHDAVMLVRPAAGAEVRDL